MKDTSSEMAKMHFEALMSRSSRERIMIASSMFKTARKAVIASMPKDLAPDEFKKQLYQRTYGKSLPEDFQFK